MKDKGEDTRGSKEDNKRDNNGGMGFISEREIKESNKVSVWGNDRGDMEFISEREGLCCVTPGLDNRVEDTPVPNLTKIQVWLLRSQIVSNINKIQDLHNKQKEKVSVETKVEVKVKRNSTKVFLIILQNIFILLIIKLLQLWQMLVKP